MNNVAAIACMEAEHAIKALPEGADTETRVRAAMKATYRHWLAPSETDAFNAAVAASLLTSEGNDRAGLEQEAKMLRALNQVMNGGNVMALTELTADPDLPVVGLLKLWDETKAAAK